MRNRRETNSVNHKGQKGNINSIINFVTYGTGNGWQGVDACATQMEEGCTSGLCFFW